MTDKIGDVLKRLQTAPKMTLIPGNWYKVLEFCKDVKIKDEISAELVK